VGTIESPPSAFTEASGVFSDTPFNSTVSPFSAFFSVILVDFWVWTVSLVWGTLALAAPDFWTLAAALAAATLAAAAVGLTAVVEFAALLAVDEEGLVVAELLDLLNPELDFDEVDAALGAAGALGATLAVGLLETSLFVVAVILLGTVGLGLVPDVELALDGCLETVGVALDLVAGGRGAVVEVGRFGGSVLVSTALLSADLGLDGMVLGTVGLVVGFADPFSAGLAAKGFLSVILVDCVVAVAGLAGRLVASPDFSAGLVALAAAASTVDEAGLVPAALETVEGAGLAGPVLEEAEVEDDGLDPAGLGAAVAGFVVPVLGAATAAGLGVVLFTWARPGLVVARGGALPGVLLVVALAGAPGFTADF